MNNHTTKATYTELQQGIDVLVGKFGMPKTIQMIRQLSGIQKSKTQNIQRNELLYTFLIHESKKVFRVPNTTDQDTSSEFKDARMACYYLMQQHTDLKYRAIGKYFGHGKFAVYYHIKKCKEFLSIPQFHRSFVERFGILEISVIEFLTKL